MGILDWLTGSKPPKYAPAPPMANYPTQEDAAYARSVGAFYGTPMENYAHGRLGHLFADPRDGRSLPGVGQSTGALVNPENGVPTDYGINQRMTGEALPNANVMADTYARAGLAANRSAIAGLGLDPTKFSMDAHTAPGSTNLAGMYSPATDHGFVVPGETPDDASTLTHEALHRGLAGLRSSGKMPLFKEPSEFQEARAEPRASEEALVRIIMEQMMGNPETGETAVGMKSMARDEFFNKDGVFGNYLADYIARLEAAAAQEIARRRPGGPR